MDELRQKRMTARRKFEVYLETRQKDVSVGEILRRHGLHLNDLRRIEAQVERAALEALKGRRNGPRPLATPAEHEALVQELAQKENALAELLVEYTLLKKSERLGWKGPWKGSTSTVSGDGR